MYNFGQIPSAIFVDWAVFGTFLDFTKMWTRWNFESIFLKIVHQKGIFDAIKKNPSFPNCRRILDIYWQWLLNKLRCVSEWNDRCKTYLLSWLSGLFKWSSRIQLTCSFWINKYANIPRKTIRRHSNYRASVSSNDVNLDFICWSLYCRHMIANQKLILKHSTFSSCGVGFSSCLLHDICMW